jgi:Mrp family chromosome partitioning ATPase
LSATDLYQRHAQSTASHPTRVHELIAGQLEIREASVPAVVLPHPRNTDEVELLRLYNAIEDAIPGPAHRIIQLVSADSKDANVEVAYNLAWIGAAMLGKRVLFVDAGSAKSRWRALPSQPKVLLDVVLGKTVPEEVIVTETNRNLFVATLQHERASGHEQLAVPQIRTVLEHLRKSFDMIIIAPTPSLNEPLAAILKTAVDGSIIVVEAGLSTARQVGKCASLLSSDYRPLIGAVMRRKNPIPRWLRRWF